MKAKFCAVEDGSLLVVRLTTAACLMAWTMVTSGFAADVGEQPVRQLAIVIGDDASEPAKHAARILAARICKRSKVSIDVVDSSESMKQRAVRQAELTVVVGVPEKSAITKEMMAKLDARLPSLPNSTTVHPESFAVKSGEVDGKQTIVIGAAEPRATIYGVGALLRAIAYLPDAVLVPEINVQGKPALWMRGGQPSGPGSRDRQLGNLRQRTGEEHQEVMEDLMLLGTNVFEGPPKQIRSYGMMTRFGRTANQMPEGFPKEWGAEDGRSKTYVCPSVPEARAALLDSFDKMFRDSEDFDFFSTNSGDEGGCRCEKCEPWGGTYIKLVHEMAERLHKYHPNCKILATNQDLTNEGNRQILDYLNSRDSSWLFALRYGPGADEMQTYIRGPVNPARFEYEGFGPLGNYLKDLHHELPRETQIALYTDITHWMQAQFAVPRPDVALAAVYDRRSWNARPRNFHKVAQEIFHYALGDIHYSEGIHDDFNKWVWYRLLWNPHQSAEALTKEYCSYWFGPDAADEMAEAIFLMEETLEQPVLGNARIAKAIDLCESAGKKIPENLLRSDWRWRVISQKALIDRYIQLMLERGTELQHSASPILETAATSSSPATDLKEALRVLDQPPVTDEMKLVLDRTKQLGEESNQIAGYRMGPMFIVDSLDLSEIGWWKKTLADALASGKDSRMQNAAKMVLHYQDPGEGGFYEDLGWPNESPRLTRGNGLWGFRAFPGPAKQSQYNLAYSFFDRGGISLKFEGLDPKAQYVVRLSTGTHREKGDGSERLGNIELKEGLQADGQVVSEGFEIPRNDITFQEFDLPPATTQDGQVEITLTSPSKTIPLTLAYEVWLMRQDKMPWTARP